MAAGHAFMLSSVLVFLSKCMQTMYITLHFHTLIGYPLSSKELLALVHPTLPQAVIDSLQQTKLDLKTTGDPQPTLEEVRRLLHSLEQHETDSNLRQLDSGMTKL